MQTITLVTEISTVLQQYEPYIYNIMYSIIYFILLQEFINSFRDENFYTSKKITLQYLAIIFFQMQFTGLL